MKKILTIIAHPDDEILGVAGTLLKHKKNGDEIYICIVTKAYEPEWTKKYIETKREEQKKIDKALGVEKRYNLDFHTTKLNSIPYGIINKKVTEIVDTIKPDIIYTHSSCDLHHDHKTVFYSCMVATRPPKRIRLICFETLSETEWNNDIFAPNYWVDIEDFIDKKIELFEIYKSEVNYYPNPRSSKGIKILAQKRGIDVCMKYAEAFQIIKEYWING